MWLALRGVESKHLWDALGTARERPGWIALFLGSYFVLQAVRTLRWHVALNAVAPVPFREVLPVFSVGFMAIVLLPLRLGELIRPYLIAGRGSGEISFSNALCTCVVERTADGLALVALFFATLGLLGGTGVPGWLIGAGYLSAGAFAGVLSMLGLMAWKREAAIRMLRATVGRASKKVSDALEGMVLSFLEGLRLFRPASLLRFTLLTGAAWAAAGLGAWAACMALGVRIHVVEAFRLLAVLNVGTMIPSSPGFVGTFEGFVRLGLEMTGWWQSAPAGGASIAAAAAVILHAGQFLPILLFGVLFLLIHRWSLGDFVKRSRSAMSELEGQVAEEAGRAEEERGEEAGGGG